MNAVIAEQDGVSRSQALFMGRNFFLTSLFRFVLVYLFLVDWVWLDELAINPTRPVRPIFNATFGKLALWSGRHIFQLTGPLHPNSFRDTRYLYLVLFTVLVVSVLLTIAWIFADRPGRLIPRAYDLLRVWIRFTLAYMVLIYAMDKVFRLQFPFPSIQRLIEPYGDSSPMALLWTYVGYSGFMTVFSGLAEAAGAVLLLFRRTAPLGAFVTLVMMANVALMDFSYDVSVKMLAVHFLLMSIFLLSHDAERLLNVLVFHRPANSDTREDVVAAITPRPVRRFLPLIHILIVIYVIVPVTVRTYHTFRLTGPYVARVPMYGLYAATSAKVNGNDRPLLVTDAGLWRYLIVEHPGEATLKTMDNTLIVCDAKYDAALSRLEIHSRPSSAQQINLLLTTSGDGDAILAGSLDGSPVNFQLRTIDVSSFTLVNRGFHWINETSFSK